MARPADMSFRRFVFTLLLGAVLLPVLQSCASFDQRRNCNHPQHEDWVKERQMRGSRVQNRSFRG